jgi:hypothetical protein
MKTRSTLIILFIIAFVILSAAVYSQKLGISGSVKVDDNKPTGTVITVEKDGAPYKKISISETGKFYVGVPFQAEIIMSFEKKGYVTKKIAISTKVPPAVVKDEMDPVTFNVSLFKQYEGMNTIVFNQPVGRYKFDEAKDEFFFDTDYTKSIQSQIAQVEAEVEVKQKEEKEQQQSQLTNNKNKKDTITDTKNAKGRGGNDDRFRTKKVEGDDQRKMADGSGGQDNADDKKAKGRENDEWKKLLQNKGKVTDGNDTNEKLKAKYKEDEERKKQLAEARAREDEENKKKNQEELKKAKERMEDDKKAREEAEMKAKEEARNMMRAKAENEQQMKLNAKEKEEEEARRLAEAKAKLEEEYRKATSSAKRKSLLAKIYPAGITIEKKKEPLKETNRVIVNRDSLANEYIEVLHSWGGKFYFKNGETISRNIFIKETSPKGTEPVYIKTE